MSQFLPLVRAIIQRDGDASAVLLADALSATIVQAGMHGTDAPLIEAAGIVAKAKGTSAIVRAVRAGLDAVGTVGTRAGKKGRIPAFLVQGLTYGKMTQDTADALGAACAERFALAFAEEFTRPVKKVTTPDAERAANAAKVLSTIKPAAFAAFCRTTAARDLLARMVAVNAAADATEAARAAGSRAVKAAQTSAATADAPTDAPATVDA